MINKRMLELSGEKLVECDSQETQVLLGLFNKAQSDCGCNSGLTQNQVVNKESRKMQAHMDNLRDLVFELASTCNDASPEVNLAYAMKELKKAVICAGKMTKKEDTGEIKTIMVTSPENL